MKYGRTGEHMRRERKKRFFNIGILILALLAFLAVLLLCRVRKMTVSGNERYSAEEIEEGLITDFLTGNTLYLWWTCKDGDIPDTLPYLEELNITMTSPVSIRVEVKEKELVGYFDDGSYVYFDASGVVLEITDEVYEDIPVITGASLGEVTLYQKVPTESSSQLRTILSLLELLDYQGLTAEEIRFAEDSSITVYIGYIEASLGQDEYLEEKIANLKAILDTMDGTEAGVLYLENVTGKNEDIVFSPSGEVVVETESETKNDTESQDGSSEDTSTGVWTDDSTLGGATTDGGAATGSSADSSVSSSDDGTGDSSGTDGSEDSASASDDAADSDSDDSSEEEDSGVDLMVFNSSGQLVYNVRVKDGVVVDSSGNEVPGCYVNEDGNVVDAYMNEIDPATGDVLNLD
ncbi:MAG: cell division protein FtsQ/DivIB [Lachnospiraceae bacterium]|nr:cell division protein FtsQ/DivIB [Lachnospiraceae bacterium]